MTSVAAIFRALNRARVRYLLVGGYASVVHGAPRTTVDIDIAVDPDPGNVGRAVRTLARLRLVPETSRVDEILAQGGVTASNDRSVDLLTSLKGADFGQLYRRRVEVRARGARIKTVSSGDQVRLLRASGRPKDLEDADTLEAAGRRG